MPASFTAATRDSLSNLAASLNVGRDKAAGDAFFLFDLDRSQIEAMYRGDWLARKIVDIVPYDMVREWRQWSGDSADVAAAQTAERRFGLRKLVQRALTLGRLYGGAAIIIGTGESDPAALAYELVPEWIRPGAIKFLHVLNRWELSASAVNRDPLSPWCGEPAFYEVLAPGRGALRLHPSRVVRFLGNELPDPSHGLSVWSDSVLQTLYDAIHAVALTTTGATSLMHEAKVDVVTVPNLSEHLSSAATTQQLSARFSYAAAMKSLNNLLLLGDGETWSRQKIDFSGLPEMVRTFLQVAAGAADIPVTRLLGQSPSGMSATGESDTRNYYDMVSARQELDLRPQLERLDALLLRSAGIDPSALSFEFRPLWQMDAAEAATIALQKAQASQIYAGLNLWPAAVTAKLIEAQLAEDGFYPGAETIFADASSPAPQPATDFDPNQPRDPDGRWAAVGGGVGQGADLPGLAASLRPQPSSSRLAKPHENPGIVSTLLNLFNPIETASAQEVDPEEENRGLGEESPDPTEPIRIQRYANARTALKEIDPNNRELTTLSSPGYVPTEADIARLEAAARTALAAKADLVSSLEAPLEQPKAPAPPLAGLSAASAAASELLRSLTSPKIDLYPEIRLGPPGLIIKVTGSNTTERGDSYAQGIRDYYGVLKPKPTNVKGRANPDGVIGEMAIEAKYTDDWSESHYNPNLDKGYPNNSATEIVNQAKKYADTFPAGVRWFTNSPELAETYTDIFKRVGVKNFTFTVVPASR